MTPSRIKTLCLLGGVIVAACDKQGNVEPTPSLQPDPVAVMFCTERKTGKHLRSLKENDIFILGIKEDCEKANPTALLIAECTYRYAEHMKSLDERASKLAEEECKKLSTEDIVNMMVGK